MGTLFVGDGCGEEQGAVGAAAQAAYKQAKEGGHEKGADVMYEVRRNEYGGFLSV